MIGRPFGIDIEEKHNQVSSYRHDTDILSSAFLVEISQTCIWHSLPQPCLGERSVGDIQSSTAVFGCTIFPLLLFVPNTSSRIQSMCVNISVLSICMSCGRPRAPKYLHSVMLISQRVILATDLVSRARNCSANLSGPIILSVLLIAARTRDITARPAALTSSPNLSDGAASKAS